MENENLTHQVGVRMEWNTNVLREVRTRQTKIVTTKNGVSGSNPPGPYTAGTRQHTIRYTHVEYLLYARLVVLLRQITDEITDLSQRV